MEISNWRQQLSALLEVIGIFVIGTLLARLAARGLNLGPANLRSLDPGVTPDFVKLSQSSAINLVLRYGFIFALAFTVGWWHRKRRLSEYGITMMNRPLREHIKVAVLLFTVVAMLPLLLRLLSQFLPLGRAPEHWTLIESLQNRGIWLYLFVGSFGLVPIAEELLARGYIQSRLSEDFGTAAAILITSLFFTFSHTQYFLSSVIGVGMLISLLIGSIACGYVRFRTGSVLPTIIAHSLGNLPFRSWVVSVVFGFVVIMVIIKWRVICEYTRSLCNYLISWQSVKSALIGSVFLCVILVQIIFARKLLPISGVIALILALTFEFQEKQSKKQIQCES